MADADALWTIVGDLIEISRLQAKQIEKLVTHVEQVTTRMAEAHQFAVIVSELAELEHRWKAAKTALESKR
jgi:hypothetical protein